MSCATDNQPPLTPWERVAAFAAILWPFLALFAVIAASSLFGGCVNPNTGVSAAAGDITTLPEISDASDNINIKVLYMMTGARVWTAKNAIVKMEYENAYTNRYFGIIETQDRQKMKVVVEPCEAQQPSDGGDGGAK